MLSVSDSLSKFLFLANIKFTNITYHKCRASKKVILKFWFFWITGWVLKQHPFVQICKIYVAVALCVSDSKLIIRVLILRIRSK